MFGTFDHSDARLQRDRQQAAHVSTNLYNAGLVLPVCAVAYRAALFAGATAEVAFEAARHAMLVELPPVKPGPYSTYELIAGRNLRDAERIAAREEQIARVRALPNPFALQPVTAFGTGIAAGNESIHEVALGVAA